MEAHRRVATDAAAEDGRSSVETRTTPAADPGPQQQVAKPSVAQIQPLPLSEDQVPAHVAVQVSKQISRAVLSGDPTIRMHLNPPELGMLKIQIEWSQDALKIEMVTDRHQSRDLILASSSELKEALGDQGFRVEKMEVVVNDPSGEPMHHPDREHREPSRPSAERQEGTGFPVNNTNGEQGPAQPISLGGHLLDLVA
jgi:flagellar hook-length control protein FliK